MVLSQILYDLYTHWPDFNQFWFLMIPLLYGIIVMYVDAALSRMRDNFLVAGREYILNTQCKKMIEKLKIKNPLNKNLFLCLIQ